LREVVPGLRRLAIMANVYPAGVLEMEEIQATARALGLEVIALEIRRGEDITLAFEGLKSGADALYISPDALINTKIVRGSLYFEYGMPVACDPERSAAAQHTF
jgi:putative tryptophan/tyrosine transport system substrate-binding protein